LLLPRALSRIPIFAAIKRWKEACAIEQAGFDARGTAEEAFGDRYGNYYPGGLPEEAAKAFERTGERTISPAYSLRTHEQITALKSGELAEYSNG
jgi:hypothetical protein